MKITFAAIIYLVAFVAHLIPIQTLRQQKSYAEWLDTLHAFGGSPFPGTEVLLVTLRVWWLYPLVAATVFVYYLVIRKKVLVPVLFMVALALFWWGYFYGPYIVMGHIV